MGGVDRADQRSESYALDRKTRRSWLRIFLTFWNITLCNAFVISKSRTKIGMAYLDFLSSITTSQIEDGTGVNQLLLSKNSSRTKNTASGRKISFNAPDNTEPHLPIVSGQGRCAICSTTKMYMYLFITSLTVRERFVKIKTEIAFLIIIRSFCEQIELSDDIICFSISLKINQPFLN